MSKYLYGAAVQGIQDFIFKTNKLRDIIGASELVARVCTTLFTDLMGEAAFAGSTPKVEMIVKAAGNIKCLFDDEALCKKAVNEFPRKVMLEAPGITISQAVVTMDNNMTFGDAVEELERRLRIQRNKPAESLTTGLIGIERAQATGLPAVKIDNEGRLIDEGTVKKREAEGKQDIALCIKSFGENVRAENVPFELGDLKGKNDWIAIIHADGNGLGRVIEKKGHDMKELSRFSVNLDDATKAAARKTFQDIKNDYDIKRIIPLRPIVLSGDDMTIICRADLALDYASLYLKNFELETEKKGQRLTACAGIAFVKSKFPFYYGYQLAESLCELAKKDARIQGKDSPSCLMFHKVQSAFFDNYESIVRQELTPSEKISLKNGPYYLKAIEGRWSIDNLKKVVDDLSEEKSSNLKNAVREWLTLIFENPGKAEQRIVRTGILYPEKKDIIGKATQSNIRFGIKCYPANDILTLITIKNLKTR